MGSFLEELGSIASGHEFISDVGDEMGVSDDNIFRTGGNPVVDAYNDRQGAQRDADAQAARDRQATTDGATGLPILSDQGNAHDNYAQVTLALWKDYQDNFAPFQYEMLSNMTTQNPGLVKETVGKAQAQVGKSFDTARKNREVTMSRFGMAPDTQTRESMQRQSALSKAAAMAGAANATRMDLKQRDMQLMTSGVPNVAGRAYGLAGES